MILKNLFFFFNKCPIKDEVNLLNLDKIADEIGIKSLVAIDETKRWVLVALRL